jgi:predicted CoA-substrate-specific enzyme activase
MKYYLGIDAGSSYIKLALIDAADNMIAKNIIKRGADVGACCRQSYSNLLSEHNIEQNEIAGVIATGYGRKQVSFCDEVITEITALAVGGFSIDRDVRTIIDIGGQDSRVVSLDDSGKVVDFVMNQKCSAGTGKFLEVTSASLGVKIEDLGQLSLKSDRPLSLSSTCTVFAESEIISCVARGEKKENIIRALHNTICSQITGLYFQVNSDYQGKTLFAGGVALNEGIVAELTRRLKCEVLVPDNPQFISAYGAALFLKRKRQGRSEPN